MIDGQHWVETWSRIIGITDPSSVQIAAGIVCGGTMLVGIYFVFVICMMIIGGFFAAISKT